ncbi:MAG: serine/threonine-protein kinase [Planctomycetota bacterium]
MPQDDPDATVRQPKPPGQQGKSSQAPAKEASSSSGPTLPAAAALALSVPTQDLSNDALLLKAPRVAYQGRSVPALGGIPLLAKLGQGGMGAVYYGVKLLLQHEVAVKVLSIPPSEERQRMVERFLQEARIAARVESPHLVRVTDVEEESGLFYLVMEFVNGVSAGGLLKERKAAGSRLDEATALDICIAACKGLAVAHAQGIVHRDIKPDNVLIPRAPDGALSFSAAKLADLGLARDQSLGQTLTGKDETMGTPGFMAPEQAVSAKTAGKPADVFGLGASLYALLAGQSPFKGESSTESILKTIQQPHAPIREVRPDVSQVTSELLDRCLAKGAQQRYVDGSALLQALRVCRASLAQECPELQQAISQLTQLQSATEIGRAAQPSSVFAVAAPLATVPPALSATAPSAPAPPRRSQALVTAAAIILLGLGVGLFALWGRPKVKLGLAYGIEKEAWLKWAVAEFAKTPEGQSVRVEMLPMPAEQVYQALLNEDRRIHVAALASSLGQELFVKEWQAKYGCSPIARQENLALNPIVFMIWQDRYDALVKKYKGLTFLTVAEALAVKGGWETIAQKPEWGKVFFGLTDPGGTNSGLVTLVLMAHCFNNKDSGLAPADVNSQEFRTWLGGIKSACILAKDPESMMRKMVVEGPSSYEIVCTYESLAIEYLKDAEGRWGSLHVEYPAVNIWNDNPCCVLNVPWSSPEQQRAAAALLDFLLSESAQKQALCCGLRPAKPDVAMNLPGGPFDAYAKYGLKLALPLVCEMPNAEVIAALLDAWKKAPEDTPPAGQPKRSKGPPELFE